MKNNLQKEEKTIIQIRANTNIKKKDIEAIYADNDKCINIKKRGILQMSADFKSETEQIPSFINICLSEKAMGKFYFFPFTFIIFKNGKRIKKEKIKFMPEIDFVCLQK